MTGPTNVVFNWEDNRGKRIKLSAPQDFDLLNLNKDCTKKLESRNRTYDFGFEIIEKYCDRAMSYCQERLTDTHLFPTRFGKLLEKFKTCSGSGQKSA